MSGIERIGERASVTSPSSSKCYDLPQVMRHINGAYTTDFNVKRARPGNLFQGRYNAILMEWRNLMGYVQSSSQLEKG